MEKKVIQVYVLLDEAEKRRLKVAAAKTGHLSYEWNRAALMEKLEREEKRGK